MPQMPPPPMLTPPTYEGAAPPRAVEAPAQERACYCHPPSMSVCRGCAAVRGRLELTLALALALALTLPLTLTLALALTLTLTLT